MKFVQTLLESYFRLNEAGEDVIREIAAAGKGLGKGDGSRNTITPPNGGNTGQVGLNDKGEAFLEGGPLAGFTKVNVVQEVSTENLTLLQNWWAGGEEGSEESPQKGLAADPDIAALGRESIARLRQLEKVVPGITKKLLTILKNARILEDKGLFIGRPGASLLQKVLGVPTRGSLASIIEQEFIKPKGQHRIAGESFVGFSLNKDLKLASLKDSFDTMVEFSNAFAKSFSDNCDELDHDTREGIANHVIKDPKTNSYFFKNMFDPEGMGIALSVADQNPINMMAKAYSDNLKKCNEDDTEVPDDAHAIPEKKIHQSSLTGSKHSVANIVKDISESGAVAFFKIWDGGRLKGKSGAARIKDGIEEIKLLLQTYGEKEFDAVNLAEEIEAGHRMSDEEYRELVASLESQNITDGDAVISVLRNLGETYFRKSLRYLRQLEPDFVVRVGNTAPKGDKSDVDYIKKDKPKREQLPDGTEITEVDFSQLSKEAQEEILKEAKITGVPRQDKYWLIKDSLKMYKNDGEVKFGSFASLRLEARRLFADISPEGMSRKHPDYISPADKAHGEFIWASLIPPKLSDEERNLWFENKEKSLDILKKVDKMSAMVQRLFPSGETIRTTDSERVRKGKEEHNKKIAAFNTGALSKSAARTLVAESLKELLKEAGLVQGALPKGTSSKWVNDLMKSYTKGENNQHIAAMMDKTLSSLMLKKGLMYNDDGKLNKAASMPSLIAISAITASAGMDSTGIDTQSTIHIIGTGETHRGNQNKMILEPLLDLMNPKSRRGVTASFSKITIDKDGSLEFTHQRGGKASGNAYTNTNHRKSNAGVEREIELDEIREGELEPKRKKAWEELAKLKIKLKGKTGKEKSEEIDEARKKWEEWNVKIRENEKEIEDLK
jgi:hypothetical protein